MSEKAEQLTILPTTRSEEKTPEERFRSRESEELVLGFCGPLGAGIELATHLTQEVLEAQGYTVTRIKLSSFIKQYAAKAKKTSGAELEDRAERYQKLQDLGNDLRNEYQDDFLAQIAVASIAHEREIKQLTSVEDVPQKNAFLVDQIKHLSLIHI